MARIGETLTAEDLHRVQITAYEYDGLDRRVRVHSAYVPYALRAANEAHLGHEAPETWLAYDAADHLTWTSDPRGVEGQFRYDGLGRQVGVLQATYVPPALEEGLSSDPPVSRARYDTLDW